MRLPCVPLALPLSAIWILDLRDDLIGLERAGHQALRYDRLEFVEETETHRFLIDIPHPDDVALLRVEAN